MGTIFILAGSMLGFVLAAVGLVTGVLSLATALAIWIGAGPVSALLFVALVLPAVRAVRRPLPLQEMA
ncbi:hypothetical protein [Limimaricola pyoseonensis]|uniref:Major facilitator superfamily (MFS) profile domain-containing protein n=1 Tax=Limimaricola pyoseonensis TaxID=521013 RepID=A0A1G7CFT6_9RHOB|nr:hypothetical protein [Limimaricola pyoseonensis]SDE38242.1 hypothetical protein SAMN04488567_1484 [Limimaricola pyoseonensis]